jgi:putative ABC transport system permease protein
MTAPRWQKVLRDLWINRTRTTLVILSIAIGVFAVGLVVNSMLTFMKDMDTDYLSVNPQSAGLYTSNFAAEQVEAVRRMEGVETAEGRNEMGLMVETPLSGWKAINLSAVRGMQDMQINRLRTDGDVPLAELKYREIWIERSALNLLPVKVGDTIRVRMADEQVKELKVAGIIHDISSFSTLFTGQIQAFITPETMEALGGSAAYSQLLFTVREGKSDETHINAVAAQVANKLEKAGVTVYATVVLNPGEHPISSMNRTVTAMLSVLGGMALFLSGFLVTNTINALISQQTRQIGMMKSVGATSGQLVGMYLGMLAAFGLLAFLGAAVLAALANQGFSLLMANMLNYRAGPFRVPLLGLAVQAAVAIVVPLAAGLGPVLKGTAMTVREAVSSYGLNASAFKRGWFDRLTEAAGFLSRPLLISLRNTFRKKGRLALTLITLTLGGAVFIAVFNLRGSFTLALEQALGYFLSNTNLSVQEPYRVDWIERIAEQVPDLVELESWAATNARVLAADGETSDEVLLWGPPPGSKLIQPIVTEGRWLLPEDENAVVISNHFITKRPDVKVGDTLTFQINNRDLEFVVVGKILMPGNFIPPFLYTSGPYLEQATGMIGRSYNFRGITTSSDPQVEARVARDLKTALEREGVRVGSIQTGSEEKELQGQFINVLVIILGVMAVLIALVGGIGLMGTMSMNVMERTREIGVMRSIGAGNADLYGIVLVEGAMIGLVSWGLGILLSYPFSLALCYVTGTAFLQAPMALVFAPEGIVLWLAIVLVLSILASLIPAAHAVRLTVRDVLAYE